MTTKIPKLLVKKGIKIGYLNVCYLQNKKDEIAKIISNQGDQFHFFCFAETHLTDKMITPDLKIPGYKEIIKNPNKKLETGLLLYHSSNLSIERLHRFETLEVESIWIQLKLKKNKPINIGFIYRNPAENTNWLTNFKTMMKSVINTDLETLLFGDFNINLFNDQNTWKHTYEQFNLCQCLKVATRERKNKKTTSTLIDHIYSTHKDHIIETSSKKIGISDHNTICATWAKKGVKVPQIGHHTILCRNFAKFNETNFICDPHFTNLESVYGLSHPEEKIKIWLEIFTEIYNRHAPLRKKRVKDILPKPWFNNDIADSIQQRDNCEKNDPNFNALRNKVTSLKRKAIKDYFRKLASDKTNSKSVWRGMDSISNNSAGKRASPVTDIDPISLNKHFTSITNQIINIDKSATNNLNALKDFCKKKEIHHQLAITPMTKYEVYDYLISLKQNNTQGLDNIDGKILRITAPLISETLTHIYNSCIESNYFPEALKEANIIPLFKAGDKTNPSNYRPISILSLLSKPLEKHIQKHIVHHLDKYDLIHENQSGFRKMHSCHTALTSLVEECYTNIKDRILTGVVFADFAKAFDVIDHSLLLRKLKCYNFSRNLLSLIESFLSNRKQLVTIDTNKSPFLEQKFGVPQGSILGPILFTLYINDLPLEVKTSKCKMFADDTSLTNSNKTVPNLFREMQTSLNTLTSWTEKNHMALNPEKTKFMLITTHQKRYYLQKPLPQLLIKNAPIQEVDSHVVLGINIQNNLSWANYLDEIRKRLSSKVFQLGQIKHYLDKHSRKLFFNAYIQSIIGYASSLWDEAPKRNTSEQFDMSF
jgi:hypothetical protein